MWWVFILKKIRIVAFLFFVFCFFFGGGEGAGRGKGGLLHPKIYLTLLHPNISKHFLYIVLYTFPKVVTRRIC